MPDDIRIRTQRGALRASDADRRLVEEVLNTAFVDGRLTKDELDDRLGQVMLSKTFDDLAPLTADLLPGAPVAQYATAPDHQSLVPLTEPVVDTTGSSPERDSINIVLGEQKRTTPWRMSPRTQVNVVLGEVLLDLNQAVLETSNPVVNIDLLLAEVNIFVPAGVRVQNRINTVLAETTTKGLVDQDAPVTLTLTGTVILGEVNVLGPDDNSRKSRRRRSGK